MVKKEYSDRVIKFISEVRELYKDSFCPCLKSANDVEYNIKKVGVYYYDKDSRKGLLLNFIWACLKRFKKTNESCIFIGTKEQLGKYLVETRKVELSEYLLKVIEKIRNPDKDLLKILMCSNILRKYCPRDNYWVI